MSPTDDLAWANPELRELIRRDPVAVLKDRGLNVPEQLPTNILQEFVRVCWLLWVDGKIVPIDRFQIDPLDAGLLFGRGVWESTKTINGTPWLWAFHLDRIKKSADILGIDLAPERLPDEKTVRDYVRSLTSQDVIVRLNATAGRPGRTGLVWMSAAVQPVAPESLRLQSFRNPVTKGQATLTLKTFQYATRLQIGQLAYQSGFDTALLLDEAGNVQESSHANIFVRLADGWFTPTADGGLLPGTVRQFLLNQSPLPMRERVIPYDALKEASEVFLTNSNVGIVPVTQIDGTPFAIGDETKRLMAWISPQIVSGTQYRFREQRTPPRQADRG
ncbi:MAG: aminotransferase class IV [Gemmataceae bacterium]|nr:aminotransferase class IV [Gemmataceae bacterium]